MRRSITGWLVPPMLAVAAAGASAPAPALAADCEKDYIDEQNDQSVLWDGQYRRLAGRVCQRCLRRLWRPHGDRRGRQHGAMTPPMPLACTYEDGDRETAFPTEASSGGLAVSRKVYVPATGLRFARILDIVSNPTAAPVTARLEFSGDYGTDDETLVAGNLLGRHAGRALRRRVGGARRDRLRGHEDRKPLGLQRSAKADAADDFPEGPTSATRRRTATTT